MAEELNWDDLKKQIVEDSAGKKSSAPPTPRKEKIENVDEIIARLQEKYRKQGAYIKEDELDETTTVDIKNILSPKLTISGSPSDLSESDSPIVRFVGHVYKRFEFFFDKILSYIANTKYLKELDWDLYSANIAFTGLQYLAFILVISTLLAIFAFLVSIPVFLRVSPVLAVFGPIAFAFFVFVLSYVFGRSYPQTVARTRSQEAEKYLPFALRHLAVEIRAGMGLYQAMKAVADANYGVLSEEFRRTLREIDEGKSTEVALTNLAMRSKSRGMRRAIANILRAVRIGGNLSDAIMSVANDVSFEQRMRVAEFGEKLNFFSVIFMFVGVVFPVMLAMISTIGYAPTGSSMLKAFQIDSKVLALLYLVVFPAILLFFLRFIRVSDPMR